VQLRDDAASSATVYEAAASLTVRVRNPGGFVEGVRPDNLLVTEPRPRNPRLCDPFARNHALRLSQLPGAWGMSR
jgi:hypothetical protein